MFDPVEKLKEYVRHPSVSTDPQYKAGMMGAQQFVSGLLTEIGFTVEVVPPHCTRSSWPSGAATRNGRT